MVTAMRGRICTSIAIKHFIRWGGSTRYKSHTLRFSAAVPKPNRTLPAETFTTAHAPSGRDDYVVLCSASPSFTQLIYSLPLTVGDGIWSVELIRVMGYINYGDVLLVHSLCFCSRLCLIFYFTSICNTNLDYAR